MSPDTHEHYSTAIRRQRAALTAARHADRPARTRRLRGTIDAAMRAITAEDDCCTRADLVRLGLTRREIADVEARLEGAA